MFDIGFWEILLIIILALIVIGPERLPGAARTAGYWLGRARRYVEGVRSDVESEFDVGEFKRLIHNQEVQLNELRQKLGEQADFSGDKHVEHRYDPADDPDYELIEEDDLDERKIGGAELTEDEVIVEDEQKPKGDPGS